ncbi:MAG: NAD(P)-binding domain-containing protein [Myxococcaceae bacterium]|nr:NAD(P)-binding domain-containing protein [Myxococcaceae bacterium]
MVFDRGHDVGGNWVFTEGAGHSSVFETTHIISSKAYSEYDDFPMPADYPDYPSHRQLAAYFQAYARHFGLYRFIRFGTLVVSCTRSASGGWTVVSEKDGQQLTERFDQLVVANGHHWQPRLPRYEGTFTGTFLHSHDYKRAAPFAGQRVLVIGGGNSACDVAVETSRVSARTELSWRRGYWIVPKFVFGVPGDHIHNVLVNGAPWVPRALRTWVNEQMLKLINGPNARYGLPEPDHDFGATHPTINSELLYFLRHGRIGARPDIARLEGKTVHFVDGTTGDYDAIIACTGYVIAHPFFEKSFLDYSEGPVPLYLKMIHPQLADLHFIGLFQPLGCIWPAAALQAKLMARRLTGRWSPPGNLDEAVRAELAHPDIEQVSSPRHTITVDYPVFRRKLLDLLGEDFVRRVPVASAA